MYELDVRCLEGEMNVTSDHLTLIPPEQWDTNRMDDMDSGGEELMGKRGPQFGVPAGPGVYDCLGSLESALIICNSHGS